MERTFYSDSTSLYSRCLQRVVKQASDCAPLVAKSLNKMAAPVGLQNVLRSSRRGARQFVAMAIGNR
jgi:hypothetical protein